MNDNDSIEVTGATVDEAINEALARLGAAEDDVVIEVLSTPRSGVLGLGARAARVRVARRAPQGAYSQAQSPPHAAPKEAAPSRRPPPSSVEQPVAEPLNIGQPAAEKRAGQTEGETGHTEGEAGDEGRRSAAVEEQGREATSILSQILELMGEKVQIRTAGSSSEEIEVEIKGDGSGILIGRHGQTLDAIEYLVNRILARRIKDAVPVTIDTESYRERRRHQLERMALSMGERVKREHIKMALEPMSPRDRRIVHLALKDDPLLTTRSSGEGYMRTVEIVPVEGRQGRGERTGRGTGRRRQEPEPPIGQQGGFKHGQKKIV